MTRLPIDSDGYSVNQNTGTIHTRYAGDHAAGSLRTRTPRGVETLLDGRKGKLCAVCYSAPRYPTPPTDGAPQRRRVPAA